MPEEHKLVKFIREYKDGSEPNDFSFEPLKYKNKKILKTIEIEKCFEVFSKDAINDKKDNIKEGCPVHRYCHYEKFKKGKKFAIYILFNPSNATPEKSDPTVNMCREIAQNEKFGEMIIVNLFSERSTKSNMFNKAYIENSNNNHANIKFLEKLFNEAKKDLASCVFIKAWGFAKNNKYQEIISKVEDLIPKNATIKIIGIKETAINMNHHPGCIKWIGGTEYAKLKDEIIPPKKVCPKSKKATN